MVIDLETVQRKPNEEDADSITSPNVMPVVSPAHVASPKSPDRGLATSPWRLGMTQSRYVATSPSSPTSPAVRVSRVALMRFSGVTAKLEDDSLKDLLTTVFLDGYLGSTNGATRDVPGVVEVPNSNPVGDDGVAEVVSDLVETLLFTVSTVRRTMEDRARAVLKAGMPVAPFTMFGGESDKAFGPVQSTLAQLRRDFSLPAHTPSALGAALDRCNDLINTSLKQSASRGAQFLMGDNAQPLSPLSITSASPKTPVVRNLGETTADAWGTSTKPRHSQRRQQGDGVQQLDAQMWADSRRLATEDTAAGAGAGAGAEAGAVAGAGAGAGAAATAAAAVDADDDFGVLAEREPFKATATQQFAAFVGVASLIQLWVGLLTLMWGTFAVVSSPTVSDDATVLGVGGLFIAMFAFAAYVVLRSGKAIIGAGVLWAVSLSLEALALALMWVWDLPLKLQSTVYVGIAHGVPAVLALIGYAVLRRVHRAVHAQINEYISTQQQLRKLLASQDAHKAAMHLQRVVRGNRARVRSLRKRELEVWTAMATERRILLTLIYVVLMILIAFCTYINLLFGVKFSSEQTNTWLMSSFVAFITEGVLSQPATMMLKILLGFVLKVKKMGLHHVVWSLHDEQREMQNINDAKALAAHLAQVGTLARAAATTK